MLEANWLEGRSPAFRLMIATSWLAPERWRVHQENAILTATAAGIDWPEYLRLLDRHGTLGLGWAALRLVPQIGVPDTVAQELKKRSDDCRKQAILYCIILADLLKRFNLAAIPAMPLKGQILSFDLYNDVGLRYSRDLDVEVQKKDLCRAQACLESLEWQPDSTFFPMSPRQWESFLEYEHSMTFIHSRTGCLLELHWRNHWETPEAARSRWARSVPVDWQGRSIQTMSPGDLVLYLCGHGCGHLWFRAKWVGDLARAHAAGLLDWKAAWNEARSSDQQNVLLVGLRLLDLLYRLPLPNMPDNTGKDLQPYLIETPVCALSNPKVPAYRTDLANFLYKVQLSHYEHVLRPRRTWRESLGGFFHSPHDFRTLSLPDSLFWAYKPLRPFLWLWRWSRQLLHRTRGL